jgi:yecA family protein
MSQNQGLEYYDVTDVLERASTSVDAADCHGLLAGLICASGFADPKVWVAEVFEAYDPRDVMQAQAFRTLQKLCEVTFAGLNSPELDFELLLPDDTEPLSDRTEALGDWCSGFLAGLGIGGLPESKQMSHELNELLEDISQISRVEFDLDEPDEEDQVSFEEVAEYVRVGVLFIHEELQPAGASPPTLQ